MANESRMTRHCSRKRSRGRRSRSSAVARIGMHESRAFNQRNMPSRRSEQRICKSGRTRRAVRRAVKAARAGRLVRRSSDQASREASKAGLGRIRRARTWSYSQTAPRTMSIVGSCSIVVARSSHVKRRDVCRDICRITSQTYSIFPETRHFPQSVETALYDFFRSQKAYSPLDHIHRPVVGNIIRNLAWNETCR